MKITGQIEQIFSQAVALDQSGGLRNTIYAIKNEIFILNYDHTVLLRFRLRKSETVFDNPISFGANDYDSNEFYEEDGNIIFVSGKGPYQRKKKCKVPDNTPEEIKELFKKYLERTEETVDVTFSRDILNYIDRDLSHIEFSAKKGQPLHLIQRNIYSGGVIDVQENQGDSFFKEVIPFTIEPIALRTNDFVSLFSFQESLKFSFHPTGKGDFIMIKSIDKVKRDMFGIVACCIYDEIIEIKEAL